MGMIVRSNGSMEVVEPKNGIYFSLEEMQKIVGGHIEICEVHDDIKKDIDEPVMMVIDEEGKLKSKPVNWSATAIYKYSMVGDVLVDVVVGDVLIALNSELNQDDNIDEQ